MGTYETYPIYPNCENCPEIGQKEPVFRLSPFEERFSDDKYWTLWGEDIYYSYDINVKPYTLATNAFDSISVSMFDDTGTLNENMVLKFTHDTVIGNSQNIFSENSTWNYKMVSGSYLCKACIRKRPYICHLYIFSIYEDHFVLGSIEN
jgi:hypothetical protein